MLFLFSDASPIRAPRTATSLSASPSSIISDSASALYSLDRVRSMRGMGSKLYDRYPEIRGIYDRLGRELTDMSFRGSIDDISKTNNLQPIMIAFQLAVLKLIRTHKPDLLKGLMSTCGLSLGEYSALALSEIIDEGDALRLVAVRGA